MAEERSLEQLVADTIAERSEDLTQRWLARIQARLGVRPRRVFPTSTMRDHIPAVLREAMGLIRDPRRPLSQVAVDKLGELARLRRRQGYDVQEVLRDFEALGNLLFEQLVELVAGRAAVPAVEVAEVGRRLHNALSLISTITTGVYEEEGSAERRELSSLLETFARTLSHELKNPLGSAEGAVRLLEEPGITADEAERRRLMAVIRRSLERARGLVEDVRSLAQAEAADENGGRGIPLRQAVRDVLYEVGMVAEESGVAIEVAEPLPELEVDGARIELALMNLVGNAIKYADPAKQDRRVRVEASRVQGEWQVSVRDNGLGIPREHQARVFERFYRAHPELSEGSGLGLAITRAAVEQLGGRIWLESEPGVGTTVHFTLPDPHHGRDTEAEQRPSGPLDTSPGTG